MQLEITDAIGRSLSENGVEEVSMADKIVFAVWGNDGGYHLFSTRGVAEKHLGTEFVQSGKDILPRDEGEICESKNGHWMAQVWPVMDAEELAT